MMQHASLQFPKVMMTIVVGEIDPLFNLNAIVKIRLCVKTQSAGEKLIVFIIEKQVACLASKKNKRFIRAQEHGNKDCPRL